MGTTKHISQEGSLIYRVLITLDSDGEKSVFGFMPYKYCASQQETARVRVSMEIEGDVSGAGASVSTAFTMP